MRHQASNRIENYYSQSESRCEPDDINREWPSEERIAWGLSAWETEGEPNPPSLSESNVKPIVAKLGLLQANYFRSAVGKFFEGREARRDQEQVPSFTSIVVPITSFAPEPYHAIAPISAVVQGTDGDYMATFFDANIGSSGETHQEAVDNLKELIIMNFESLEGDDDESLGPLLKRQKAVLRQFIKRA